MVLKNKILIGITGGIAAYKICDLVRLLTKSGCEVRVMMTENAKKFIHPNTFSALTNHVVYDDLFGDEMLHITLSKWADSIIIAPATAATISSLAHGQANNLLSSVCLATQAKCLIAPAMNSAMWAHIATKINIRKLRRYGYQIIMPDHGIQACGDIGFGRMVAPEYIFNLLQREYTKANDLSGIKILVTAGATQEKIDPVRFISNFSSGKMGYALAEICEERGATVILVSGPTHLDAPKKCQYIAVHTADEMLHAVSRYIVDVDIIISAAAIADYKPVAYNKDKIKKTADTLSIHLVKTVDILKSVSNANNNLFKVGFSAETNDLLTYAKTKLISKNLHAIIANHIMENGYPFGNDYNELVYINNHDIIKKLPKSKKTILADQLIDLIISDYKQHCLSHKI